MDDFLDAAWHQAENEEEYRMKIAAKPSNDFEPVPAGNHIAICNAIVDLGLQPGSGMYPEPKREIYIRFELPTERLKYQKDGVDMEGPMGVGRRFTASMSEKSNLRKFIESWFGKKFPSDQAAADFDLEKLLGKRCLVNVTHQEKGTKVYANLTAATPIPKGMTADQPQHNANLYFCIDTSTDAAFNALPKWMQETIAKRIKEPKKKVEYEPEFNDEIPF